MKKQQMLYLDYETTKRLKQIAVERDTNISAIIRELIAEYLKREEAKKNEN